MNTEPRGRTAIVPTKSAAGIRTIPLTPPALARTETLYKHERERGPGHDDDFVFTVRTGRPLDGHNVRRIIRTAAAAAGIAHVTPQVLRRSVVTAYAEATVPSHVAASITGHSPAFYHQHYVKPHLDQQEREQAPRTAPQLRLRSRVGSPAPR
jgi:integrase